MKRLSMVLTALVLLAACGDTLAAAPTSGGDGEQMTNTIAVSGTGEVSGVPDVLVVDLGISLVKPTVAESTAEGARLAGTVIDALKATGVAERDIGTMNYTIYPEYDYSANTQRLIGYRVSNMITARIRDVGTAGDVIDAATRAGGDAAVVNGIRFEIEENDELVKAAREVAWNDAREKAEQLAELAGVGLGRAVSISETFTPVPVPMYARAEAAMDASTPITPGEQMVTVTVNVEFALH